MIKSVFERTQQKSDQRRKGGKNTLDLVLLLGFKHAKLVVCLNDTHRLNKQSCAAGRGIVDKSRNIRSVLILYGHNESAVSLCDYCILQKF